MPDSDWIVEGYQDAQGHRPVDEFINDLSAKERARIIRTIELLKTYGIDLQMPYARHLEGKLWELRISFSRIEYRASFIV